MLIAIISDTFEKLIEQRPTFSLKNKLMILASMESMIRTKETDDEAKGFLYIITPASGDPDEDISSQSEEWRGKTHFTHNLIKSKFTSLSEENQSLNQSLKSKLDKILTAMKIDPQFNNGSQELGKEAP